MFQSTQPARGLCDNLPLTGISCSLNRCHADLPPSCCSFAMDSFRTTPGPADFGTQISPDLQLRILQECFETGQHLWRQDRKPPERGQSFPPRRRSIEISAPKTSNTNFGLRFDQVGTQSLGHLGFVVFLGTKIRGFHGFSCPKLQSRSD